MAIGSYHININFRLSRALSAILLSKMTNFSPKNLRFFAVKTFWGVPATVHQCHIDHRASADPGSQLTPKFCPELVRGSGPLCIVCNSTRKLFFYWRHIGPYYSIDFMKCINQCSIWDINAYYLIPVIFHQNGSVKTSITIKTRFKF